MGDAYLSSFRPVSSFLPVGLRFTTRRRTALLRIVITVVPPTVSRNTPGRFRIRIRNRPAQLRQQLPRRRPGSAGSTRR